VTRSSASRTESGTSSKDCRSHFGTPATRRSFTCSKNQSRRLPTPFPKQIRCQALGLGQAIGRQIAHEVVYDAARVEDTTFTEAIKRDPRVTAHLDAATIDRLLDLASHTGLPADIARAAAQRARATADGITAGR
jgi:hypothetical protein